MDTPRIAPTPASASTKSSRDPARPASSAAARLLSGPTRCASAHAVGPAGEARLAAASAELAADEAARARLARELHDGLGAELTGARFAFANLETWLPADAPEGCRRALELAQQALDAAFDAYRRALDDAAPPLDAGLGRTVSAWSEGFGARTGLRTRVVCSADARLALVGPDGTLAVLRVAQEALANVARHARATCVELTLEAGPTHLELAVADDGAGLRRSPGRSEGRGLGHLRARCAAFGGTLALAARAGGGTLLRASFGWDALLAVPGAHRRASAS
ncbi:sensor histidine kinase [Burkholderia glumae]|uniref:ATP-binding protein n=2 Tax=Burkholderia glumae TaxID=337 RepID=A0AAP9Y0J4_BURGL|nr:histidine kinase [Burkholderia glumae]ACR30404.1 Signal transduction histidine kinase [Burkholderia glumae BGR1]AJY65314.1 histidine kinase family protein [Burkholderia glumae LMG 2196 = ATCC 33617]MCM2481944.1 histidine kinase [Burkholderia glumae]MCM2491458.1 histidine kinase [Burkholderia glumae]MCM2507913.1 histidine kinase [Burkholderia glumae]